MALTLSECFEFAGMDVRSLNASTFEEVKKILLLELKSSDEGFITIGNIRYSKNDILAFFDKQDWSSVIGSENTTSMETAFASNWHNVLANPGQLVTFFQVPEELFDRSQWRATKDAIELLYGKVILDSVEPLFKASEFERLNYLLSYRPVFSDNLVYDVYAQLKIALDQLFLKMENETKRRAPIHRLKELPIFNKAFCSIISFVNNFDSGISKEVIDKVVERISGQPISLPEKKALFECFLWLPLDEQSRAYIVKSITNLELELHEKAEADARQDEVAATILKTPTRSSIERKQSDKKQDSEGITPGKIIIAIGSVIIVFTVVMLRIGSITGRSNSTPTMTQSLKLADEFSDYFFNDTEVIRDYAELKRNIEANVTNESVKHFLINQLSRFAYDQDADSLNKLTFIPVKPEPGCLPLTFSQSSNYSRVLLLIYDEENPDLPVKGALVGKNTDYSDTTLYILPTERLIAVFDPELENGTTVIASKFPALDYLNVLFESYRINPKTTRKEVYISTSEYSKGDASILNIYETMRMKRLISD